MSMGPKHLSIQGYVVTLCFVTEHGTYNFLNYKIKCKLTIIEIRHCK